MTQNQPQWVTYSGFRARGMSPTGENTSSDGPGGPASREARVSGRGLCDGRPKKWPIPGLKPVSRRDVRDHVAT